MESKTIHFAITIILACTSFFLFSSNQRLKSDINSAEGNNSELVQQIKNIESNIKNLEREVKQEQDRQYSEIRSISSDEFDEYCDIETNLKPQHALSIIQKEDLFNYVAEYHTAEFVDDYAWDYLHDTCSDLVSDGEFTRDYPDDYDSSDRY